MRRLGFVLPVLVGFVATFSNCQTKDSHYLHAKAAEPTPASLAEELDRAVAVLGRGLKKNWKTRDQYVAEFEGTPSTDSAGRPILDAKDYVACLIGMHLHVHRIWDEAVPIGVEVKQTIADFRELRDEARQAKGVKVASFRPPACSLASNRRVVLSSGVAASLLKQRVEPPYPATAPQAKLSGTVVLQVLVGTEGRVEWARAVSGPPLLQQDAVDAVRQWTYRPYLLNNVPVKFETTVNVVFAPGR